MSQSRPLDLVLQRLDGVRRSGSGWSARCPAHDDRHPSLSVTERDGTILFHCHAGCTQDAVIDALRSLGALPSSNGAKASATPEHVYRLPLSDGHVAEHHRVGDGPEKIIWWELDGHKGLSGLPASELPLYGADRLAPDATVVVLTEGEPAADALLAAGIAAVATVTGASGTPSDNTLHVLVGRGEILLWPDADQPGHEHMHRIGARLVRLDCVVRWVSWADAPEHGDAADCDTEMIKTLLEAAGLFDAASDESIDTVIPLPAAWGSPFPVEVLPADLSAVVRAHAEALQVPVGLSASLALGALWAACTATCTPRFEVRPRPDWSEHANEFVIVVLPSGERKSPAFQFFLAPIEEREGELIAERGADVQENIALYDVLVRRLNSEKQTAAKERDEAKRAAATERVRTLAREVATYQLELVPRLLADDATPEAVASLLADHRSITIASAEGGVFDMLAGRYSDRIPNLDVYLKSYSGDTIRVDRKTRPPEHIDRPALSVVLTVQPQVLRSIGAHRELFRGRGLLARFLYELPEPRVGYRSVNPAAMPPDLTTTYRARLMTILRLIKVPDAALRLDAGAFDEFQRFRERVEVELRPSGDLADIRDWGAKLPGHVLRIAAAIHVWRTTAPGVQHLPWEVAIDADTLSAAVAIGEHYAEHAAIAYALMREGEQSEPARDLLEAIVSWGEDGFSTRDLYQRVRRRFDSVAQLEAVLRDLEEAGYLTREPGPSRDRAGRPRSPRWKVNADVPSHPSTRSRNTQNTPGTPDSVYSVHVRRCPDCSSIELTYNDAGALVCPAGHVVEEPPAG